MRWTTTYSARKIDEAIDYLWQAATGDLAPRDCARRILAPGSSFASITETDASITLTMRSAPNIRQYSLQIAPSSRQESTSPHTTLRSATGDILRKTMLDSGRSVEILTIETPPEYKIPNPESS